MASPSNVKGTHSQLIAAGALLANGFMVSEPLAPDTYDFVIQTPKTKEFLKAQVKTIYHRTDKSSDYFVIYSRKSDRKAYSKEEIDVIIGVYGSRVFLIRNTSQQEYWAKPHEAHQKWEEISPFKAMMV